MAKFDLGNYAEWCKKNHLKAEESASLDKYNAELEKVAHEGEKAVKIAKQKEVFDTIAKYLGVKVKYSEVYYDDVERTLTSIVLAMAMCTTLDDVQKTLGRIVETLVGDNEKGESNND